MLEGVFLGVLACPALEHGRDQDDAAAVVLESRAGRLDHRPVQIELVPARGLPVQLLVRGAFAVLVVIGPRPHGQDVLEAHGGLAFVQVGDPFQVGKEVEDLLIDALEFAAGDGDADQGRGEALGDRLEHVELAGDPAVEILLEDEPAMADDQELLKMRQELALPDLRHQRGQLRPSRPCPSGSAMGQSHAGAFRRPRRRCRQPTRTRRTAGNEATKRHVTAQPDAGAAFLSEVLGCSTRGRAIGTSPS